MDSLRALSKRQMAATKQEPQSQQMARSSVQSQDCTFSKMHVGEDPEGFLLGFESAATQSSLPREEWAMRLAPLLSGEAQAVYQALPYYTAEDYDQLKDALLNHLDVNEKNYRKKFRSLTFSAGTKPRSVARRLRNLGRKWLKPDVRSSEEIVELIIIEQFIQILPTDAEHWLSHQETSSLESIIQMAEEYLAGKNLCKISKEDVEEARRTTHKEGVLFKGAVINSQKGLMIDKGETSLSIFPKAENEEQEKLSAAEHQDTQDTVSVPENETRSKYDRRTLKELLQTKSVSTQVIKEELPDPEEHESCRSPMTTPVETGDDAGHLLPPLSAYGGTVSNFPTLKLEEMQSMENRYICIECGKSFSMNPDSCDPRVTYNMEEPYTCAECKSQFSHSLHHIIEHQIKGNEGQYVCNECGRSFSGSAHLAIHKRKHTGERPFACGKCGMTFSQQSNLVRHQKIHKDVKPYVCTECGKSFRRGFHLTRHQLTHTGEKPYNCERCGKRFSLLSNMLVHQKRKICYSRM